MLFDHTFWEARLKLQTSVHEGQKFIHIISHFTCTLQILSQNVVPFLSSNVIQTTLHFWKPNNGLRTIGVCKKKKKSIFVKKKSYLKD